MTKDPVEQELYYLRKSVHGFMKSIPSYNPAGPILEVGRMFPEGKVYESFPDLFIDSKDLFQGQQLLYLDIDPQVKPDICDDVVNLRRHVSDGSLGAVVAVHVLEHVRQFWTLPDIFAAVLKPQGLLFIQTPWNFRFHGPRPDCWRISDDGYEELFGKHFEILKLEKYAPFGQPLHPLTISVVMRKK